MWISTTKRTNRCCRISICTCVRARPSPWWAHRRRQVHHRQSALPLLRAQAGQIRISGRDYTDFSQHAIQSRIGIVLQTPHLFSGTIRENLRYGRLDATDDEIEDAAKLAGAHDFIVTLEKGYDEEVGEGGVLLSVGQKQLISLARAVLAEPDIFIMDEATSSVDTLTEALIQRGHGEADGRGAPALSSPIASPPSSAPTASW